MDIRYVRPSITSRILRLFHVDHLPRVPAPIFHFLLLGCFSAAALGLNMLWGWSIGQAIGLLSIPFVLLVWLRSQSSDDQNGPA